MPAFLYTATILLLLFYLINRKHDSSIGGFEGFGFFLECAGFGAILFVLAIIYLAIRLSK